MTSLIFLGSLGILELKSPHTGSTCILHTCIYSSKFWLLKFTIGNKDNISKRLSTLPCIHIPAKEYLQENFENGRGNVPIFFFYCYHDLFFFFFVIDRHTCVQHYSNLLLNLLRNYPTEKIFFSVVDNCLS